METQARTAPITGKEGAEIDITTAAEWTKNHRLRSPGGTLSQFFGSENIRKILDQPGCMGIRIYYANSEPLTGWQKFMVSLSHSLLRSANAHGTSHVILSGVTSDGLDLLPAANSQPKELKLMSATTSGSSTGSDSGVLLEQAHPCPGSVGCPQNALTGS